MRRTIPETIEVLGIKTNEAHLTVDFSKEYNSLSVTEEVLMRAAIVRTLLQCKEYSLVTFTVESEPLKTKDGSLVGSMTKDSFLENPGIQINTSKQASLTLYFASGDGRSLVKETREVHYSTNISVEKLVMEQLIEGPKKQDATATIPVETKIITLSVMDGVCYVNLDNNFQNQNQEITEEVVLYSIVNSLTELSGVNKVQISINGDTSGKCRYTYDLATMYEKNLSLLETKENGN
jgi:germination protein M